MYDEDKRHKYNSERFYYSENDSSNVDEINIIKKKVPFSSKGSQRLQENTYNIASGSSIESYTEGNEDADLEQDLNIVLRGFTPSKCLFRVQSYENISMKKLVSEPILQNTLLKRKKEV